MPESSTTLVHQLAACRLISNTLKAARLLLAELKIGRPPIMLSCRLETSGSSVDHFNRMTIEPAWIFVDTGPQAIHMGGRHGHWIGQWCSISCTAEAPAVHRDPSPYLASTMYHDVLVCGHVVHAKRIPKFQKWQLSGLSLHSCSMRARFPFHEAAAKTLGLPSHRVSAVPR